MVISPTRFGDAPVIEELERSFSDNDKACDPGSDIERLRKVGIAVALDCSAAHMHHKFALFDQQWLLNGSCNWTRSASKENEENLVLTNDRQLLKDLGNLFDQLWQQFS